jgi:glycosyltransferase involved in cell wall biosynthesis
VTESRHVFVTPPLDGTPTGGTIYNGQLIQALLHAGVRAERLDLDAARHGLASGAAGAFWIDSLYLGALPELVRESTAKPELGLVAHYLPSLVARGDAWRPRDLTPVEQAALHAARTIIVPSPWLRDVLESTGVPSDRVRVVEPGVDTGEGIRSRVTSDNAPLSALLVGHVVQGKGIAPFLRALSSCLAEVPPPDASPTAAPARAAPPIPPFVLTIVGDLEIDAGYAAECRELVRSHAPLGAIVRFASALPQAEVFSKMRDADVLVSASRMESYGMALAEARALGLPILARRSGHVSAQVDPARGGELFEDDAALASALIQLSRGRDELAERRRRAERSLNLRTWNDAARDFLGTTPRSP